MIWYEKEIGNVKVSYNCLLDIANIYRIKELTDKINLEELKGLLSETIKGTRQLLVRNVVPVTIADEFIKELTKEVYRINNIIIKMKLPKGIKVTEVPFNNLAEACITSNYALAGQTMDEDKLKEEFNLFKLTIGTGAVFGLALKSYLDPNNVLTKGNEDKLFLNNLNTYGKWISENRSTEEYKLWERFFESLRKSPRNKKLRARVLEYYDFLHLSDVELVYTYGAEYAKELTDTYTDILIENMTK